MDFITFPNFRNILNFLDALSFLHLLNATIRTIGGSHGSTLGNTINDTSGGNAMCPATPFAATPFANGWPWRASLARSAMIRAMRADTGPPERWQEQTPPSRPSGEVNESSELHEPNKFREYAALIRSLLLESPADLCTHFLQGLGPWVDFINSDIRAIEETGGIHERSTRNATNEVYRSHPPPLGWTGRQAVALASSISTNVLNFNALPCLTALNFPKAAIQTLEELIVTGEMDETNAMSLSPPPRYTLRQGAGNAIARNSTNHIEYKS